MAWIIYLIFIAAIFLLFAKVVAVNHGTSVSRDPFILMLCLCGAVTAVVGLSVVSAFISGYLL